MKTGYIIGALILCIATSLYLRIVLPYEHVFTSEWVKFSGTDAYWQMSYVDKVTPNFPDYALQIFKIPFFVWLLSFLTWCIGLGSPSQHTIDTVGAYYPAILAALTVIPVYIIGKVMFGRMAGIIAAVIIAILPGEWLGRSILGFTDHHVMEVLLSTVAIMFLVLGIKTTGKKQIAYTIALVIMLFLFMRTSPVMVIFGLVIALYLINQVIINRLRHKKDMYTVILLSLGIIIVAAVYLIYPKIFDDVFRMVGALNTGESQAFTTLEMKPLFFPTGTFTFIVPWQLFGFIALLIPLAIAVFISDKTGNKGWLLLVVWTLVILVLMIMYRRFAYYFAVNAALLTGGFMWCVWHRLKKLKLVAVLVTAVTLSIMIVPNTQNAIASAKYPPYTPSDAWCQSLDWIQNNTPEDSVIMAWWDYGYWINRMAKRDTYVNPSQDKKPVAKVANMMLYGEGMNPEYIIIDHTITSSKLWAIAMYAGKDYSDFSNSYYVSKEGKLYSIQLFYPEYYQSLIVRLYNFDGKATVPRQSTVVRYNPSDRILANIDTYATYDEAISHLGLGQRLVGTSPFISPVPLEADKDYKLVYKSAQLVNGVAEVKIFQRR